MFVMTDSTKPHHADRGGIIVERIGDTIQVTSPYHRDFPRYARELRGRWDPGVKAWAFNARDEGKVREMLHLIFGTDGSVPAPTGLVMARRAQLIESARQALAALTPDERKALVKEFEAETPTATASDRPVVASQRKVIS